MARRRTFSNRGRRPPAGSYVAVANSNKLSYDDTELDREISSTPGIVQIAAILRNQSNTGRTGSSIRYKFIDLAGHIANNGSAVFNNCLVMLVYDKNPQVGTPVITDILSRSDPEGLLRVDFANRFDIVWRKDVLLQGSINSGDASGAHHRINTRINLNNRMATYLEDNSSGLVGGMTRGALWLVTVGNSSTGATAATISSSVRVVFSDV